MATTFVVLLSLGIFNFIASIIQGVAGIGDAIFMQVLWFLAAGLWPETFNETPLGKEPVRAVALIMYIRLLFMSPLVVYLGLSDSIFSKSMTIMMAIPSTILSIIGVLLFKVLDAAMLKKVLGITSFAFAMVYVFIIIYRKWRKTRQVEELKSRNVKLVVEADAIAEEAQLSRNTSIVNLHSSFVQNVPNNSIFAIHPSMLPGPSASQSNIHSADAQSQISQGDHRVDVAGSTVIAENGQEPVIDARTGLPTDTTEAFLSTIGGEVFVAPETQVPHLNEENVPPLTPSKISPSRTMTYTRVRINRNIDANGKIKMSTKIGAAVAASLAGIMASLTGVNAPPQIIFILLYDAPNYIVRVNFSAQSIPSNIVRFFMAVAQGSFSWDMTPLLVAVVVFGFAGVFVGSKIGRLLGPNSFNIFVLCLLLLCSLAMMGQYQTLLIISTFLTIVITVVCGYLENKKNKPLIEQQRVSELEVEKRLYDCLEELQRNNNSFSGHPATSPTVSLEHMQRATRPKPMWGNTNYDNDDESNNAGERVAACGVAPAEREDRGLLRGEGEAGETEKDVHVTPALAQTAVENTTNYAPRAAPATTHATEEMDERTVPAVVQGVTRNGITSVHSSSVSDSSNGSNQGRVPPRATTAAAATVTHVAPPAAAPAAAARGGEQPRRLDRQSLSLHSLNSSVQNVPSDEDGVHRR